jgi:hypothetical protein
MLCRTQIVRRKRYNEPKLLERLCGCPAPSYRSVAPAHVDTANVSGRGPLVWSIWLIGIVQALHFDLSTNLFTSRELWTSMPSSSSEFQEVYSVLLDDRTPQDRVPARSFSQEDALLLLMALLSDLLFLRRSLGQVVRSTENITKRSIRSNPFSPFSPHMELDHIEALLSLALDKWHGRFRAHASPEILALYHYTKMYLCFDGLLSLPPMAGYRGVRSPNYSN